MSYEFTSFTSLGLSLPAISPASPLTQALTASLFSLHTLACPIHLPQSSENLRSSRFCTWYTVTVSGSPLPHLRPLLGAWHSWSSTILVQLSFLKHSPSALPFPTAPHRLDVILIPCFLQLHEPRFCLNPPHPSQGLLHVLHQALLVLLRSLLSPGEACHISCHKLMLCIYTGPISLSPISLSILHQECKLMKAYNLWLIGFWIPTHSQCGALVNVQSMGDIHNDRM